MVEATTRTVLRAVPRVPEKWSDVDRTLTLALGALAADPDAPPSAGAAEHAWRRLAGPLRAAQERPGYPPGPCPDLCLVAVAPSDVEPLGMLARELGARLLPGTASDPAAALLLAAAVAGTSAPALVVELARTHGVLDLDHGTDADLLYVLAGVATSADGVRAAHDRVADRVTTMWAAGAS